MQAQIDAIKAKVQQCIATAEAKFGITMPTVQIRFDLKGRAAGVAGMQYGGFYLRFNTKHMALGGQTWEHLLNDTVPHEVAHTVCQAFPKFGRNHDTGWKRVCVALGGNGRRCYGEADAPEAIAAQRPYVYVTTNGSEVRVTKVMHTKIQRGAGYTFKGGKGQVNRNCQYNYMTAPAAKKAAAPVVVNTPAVQPTLVLGGAMVSVPVKRPAVAPLRVAATGSNAARVRSLIASGLSKDECVARAVADLGMTVALAKTYVKNNWNKV